MGRHKKQKNSNFIWWIIFIVFCFVVFLIQKEFGNFFKKETTTTLVSTTTTTINVIKYQIKEIKEEDKNYIINISYPYFNISFIDKNLSNFIDSSISNFKNYAEPPLSSSYKNTLDVIFDPYLTSNNIVSIRFIDAVYTGGAHGNQQIVTKNFDLKTGREIQLKHLFKNDDYLNYISKKAIEKLTNDNISEKNWINEGAGPKYTNFENFTFSKDHNSLMFHFSPYQVAPYSEGIIIFEVATEELKEYLR